MVAVDHAVNVQHDDGSEAFGVVLHGLLHIVLNVFVFNFLGNQFLSFHVEGVGRQHEDPLSFAFSPRLLLLTENLQQTTTNNKITNLSLIHI